MTPLLTSAVWSQRSLVARAGIIIYLAHLSMPELVQAEEAHGTRFHSIEQLQQSIQRTAWIAVAAHGGLPEHPFGVNDPVIAGRLVQVKAMHHRIPMPKWGMAFLTSVIAIAPAWAQGASYRPEPAYHECAGAMAQLMGASIPPLEQVESWLRGMFSRRAAPTAYGRKAIATVAEGYEPLLREVIGNEVIPMPIRTLVADVINA